MASQTPAIPVSQSSDDGTARPSQTAENTCPRCSGRGRLDDGNSCPDCGGSGRVNETVADA